MIDPSLRETYLFAISVWLVIGAAFSAFVTLPLLF